MLASKRRIRQRLWRLWAALAIALLAAPAPAQEATEEATVAPGEPLAYGEVVQGQLTEENPAVLYHFAGEAGDIVAITMRSDQVDPYLRLMDTAGNVLVFDDDGAGDLDARIGPVVLPEDGLYVIVASSFEAIVSEQAEIETGRFELDVTLYEALPIGYPGEFEDVLGRDEALKVYWLEGETGDILRLSLESDDFDPLLVISEADHLAQPVARDDDSGGDLNALIVPFVVPASRPYLLTVTGYRRYNTGAYRLRIEVLEAQALAFGETVETTLSSEQQAVIYTFEGRANERVDIVVEAADRLDTTLTLFGPDGEQLAFSDDANGLNPEVRGQPLPEDGTYRILVQPFRRGSTGALTVTLSLSRESS